MADDHHHHHHHDAPSSDDFRAAWAAAYEAAQPDPGRRVIEIDLDAREDTWEFVPGVSTPVWPFNGTVPGPTIEAMVGDVLERGLYGALIVRAPDEPVFDNERVLVLDDVELEKADRHRCCAPETKAVLLA